jgi:hypothetical protein
VYSAVTPFDTTYTSIDSAPFDGAGSGVISGLVSSAGEELRFDSLGVPYYYCQDSAPFDGAGSGVISELVSSAGEELRLDSRGVPYYYC